MCMFIYVVGTSFYVFGARLLRRENVNYVAGTNMLFWNEIIMSWGRAIILRNKIIKSRELAIITWERDNYFMETRYYNEHVFVVGRRYHVVWIVV